MGETAEVLIRGLLPCNMLLIYSLSPGFRLPGVGYGNLSRTPTLLITLRECPQSSQHYALVLTDCRSFPHAQSRSP